VHFLSLLSLLHLLRLVIFAIERCMWKEVDFLNKTLCIIGIKVIDRNWYVGI